MAHAETSVISPAASEVVLLEFAIWQDAIQDLVTAMVTWPMDVSRIYSLISTTAAAAIRFVIHPMQPAVAKMVIVKSSPAMRATLIVTVW